MNNYLEFTVSNDQATQIFDAKNSNHLPIEAVLNTMSVGMVYVGGPDVSSENYNFGPITPTTIINISHSPDEDVYVIASDPDTKIQAYYPVNN